MKTEITYEDTVSAYGPIVDAQKMVRRLMDLMGDESDFLAVLEEKLYRAGPPIRACLERIEKENPEQFS